MTNPLIDAGGLLLLPRLQVQNVNAISGPLTWGFPSPTAFTGFVHALERRLRGASSDMEKGLDGVGIICHQFDPQIARRRNPLFCLTRTPIYAGWKKFENKPATIVEEGRAHMEVSLLIAVKGELGESDGERWATLAHHVAQGMRLAGGSILPARNGERYQARWQPLPDYLDGQNEVFSKLRRRLLPGFALVHRDDLLGERLAELRLHQAGATVLDALLDLSRLNFEPTTANPDKPDEVLWQARKRPGWLVPLPIGYAGLSPLYQPGVVDNARDQSTPFRFVESLYSLGEWVGPHCLENLQQLLWHTEEDTENGIYRCVNRYSEISSIAPAASH